jgi:hypothetical protein
VSSPSSASTAGTKTSRVSSFIRAPTLGPYLERGIPIIQFFDGLHPDYHRPTDEVSKLDIGKIVNVSKLSFGALWLAADDPVTPKWDGIIPHTLWWVKPRR